MGTAVAHSHYCSSTGLEKKGAAPATWPLCHACTLSPATHTQEGLVAPGGTTRSLHCCHVWQASRAKQRGAPGVGTGPGWRQGSGVGWVGVEVKPGGALFLPLLSPDWPFSFPSAPPALHPLDPPPFSPFCGPCTCSPWVWAIKLKDLSTGGWRKSGGIIKHEKHKSNRFQLWLFDMVLCHIPEWWAWCDVVWHRRSEFKQICVQIYTLFGFVSLRISLIWHMISLHMACSTSMSGFHVL